MRWLLCLGVMVGLLTVTGCYDIGARDAAYERALQDDLKRRDAAWAKSGRMAEVLIQSLPVGLNKP